MERGNVDLIGGYLRSDRQCMIKICVVYMSLKKIVSRNAEEIIVIPMLLFVARLRNGERSVMTILSWTPVVMFRLGR